MTSSRPLWKQLLRWVAMLPCGLAASAAVRLLIRNWSTVEGGAPPVDDGLLAALLIDFTTVASAAALVVGGALIAPAGRVIVATVLGTLNAGSWWMLLFLELSLNRVLVTGKRPGALWVLIGSVLGVVFVHRQEGARMSSDVERRPIE